MKDFTLLSELAECARSNRLPVYRIAMYKDGEIREEEIIPTTECVALYSVSKNFITTGCGMCISDGILSLDDTVWDYFHKDKPFLDPLWKDVTLERVLSQTTGTGGMFLDIDCDDVFSWGEGDWLDFVLKRPFVHNPGEVFDYTDSNFYIAARFIAKATGMSACTYISERFFYNLKMQGWAWSCCPEGHPIGGSGLYLRCRDMTKLGALYMNDGAWEGEQIISPEFAKRAVSPISHPNDDCDYGLSFWLPKHEPLCSFRGSGMNNQAIWVSKSESVSVAWQAYDPRGEMGDKFDRILNSL